MSIIHDALKKAQKDLQKQDDLTPDDIAANLHAYDHQDAASQTSSQTSSKKNKVLVGLICVFFLAIGIFTAINIGLFKESASSSSEVVQTQVKETTKKIAAFLPKKEVAPAPVVQQNDDTLQLKGTMLTNNKYVALINNEIYEIGEYIDSAKIINITLEKVELLDDTQIRTLYVKK